MYPARVGPNKEMGIWPERCRGVEERALHPDFPISGGRFHQELEVSIASLHPKMK